MYTYTYFIHINGLPWWLSGKESACNAGDVGLIPGLGRSPGERNGSPLQYSCLKNPMDGGAWKANHMCLTSTVGTNSCDIKTDVACKLNFRNFYCFVFTDRSIIKTDKLY